MLDINRILVVGAGAPLGLDIVRRLAAMGKTVMAAYRTPRPALEESLTQAGGVPVQMDMGNRDDLRRRLTDCDAAVFTPILTTSRLAAPLLRSNQPAVFFSSNNVAVVPEDPIYAGLATAERTVHATAPHTVILRPTMIYGSPGSGNLSRLMLAFRRWPVMLRPAGKALQQPVFFRDLGGVAVTALLGPEFAGRTISVGGPDVVNLRDLYAKVAAAAGVYRPVLPVPVGIAARFVAGLQSLGMTAPVSSHQLQRAKLDKTARGTDVITTETPLETGLQDLAEALRRQGRL
ncbi:MAG: hypothetical protein QNJ44_02240 [Rhodobacter sp.]|nr:hypothetical protein [Rhodobacter sp.]